MKEDIHFYFKQDLQDYLLGRGGGGNINISVRQDYGKRLVYLNTLLEYLELCLCFGISMIMYVYKEIIQLMADK